MTAILTGIDMVEIARIRKSISGPRFLTRVFSEKEREYFMKKRDPAPSVAANFAAKEAFAKAVGTGFRGFAPAQVQVLRRESGAAYLELTGAAAELAAKKNASFSVSLTHTDKIAAAVVVMYYEEQAQ